MHRKQDPEGDNGAAHVELVQQTIRLKTHGGGMVYFRAQRHQEVSQGGQRHRLFRKSTAEPNRWRVQVGLEWNQEFCQVQPQEDHAREIQNEINSRNKQTVWGQIERVADSPRVADHRQTHVSPRWSIQRRGHHH